VKKDEGERRRTKEMTVVPLALPPSSLSSPECSEVQVRKGLFSQEVVSAWWGGTRDMISPRR